jgi:hypothetical protein
MKAKSKNLVILHVQSLIQSLFDLNENLKDDFRTRNDVILKIDKIS